MATTPVVQQAPTVPAPARQKPRFVRFIDSIGHFIVHEGPAILKVAQDVEPVLALTPFGPEYALVVNSIVGIQKVASASAAAGSELTGEQKMALVLAGAMPALKEILQSKGVTADHDEAIAGFIQAVYDLHAGPAVVPQLPASTDGKVGESSHPL